MPTTKPSLEQKFVSSIDYDVRLAPYDITGSIAHVRMLARKKIIPAGAAARILRGLKSILADLNRGKSIPPDEDIHFAIEKELIRRIGDAGRMMHTARSRNDQVVTDLYLYLRAQCRDVRRSAAAVQRSIVAVAERYDDVVMPGYTHLQHAQPILYAHHLLAYAWMLERDKSRFADLDKRLSVLPLGSAALAGTSFPIDRRFVARLLGFGRVGDNSIDATASRDLAVEFVSNAAIVMAHLSRLAEELILWSSEEFGFVRLAKSFTTGSSIMPQKRNPDMAELVRGKTGRVFGDLTALLVILKGTPLAYNRDLQEDKPPVFDATDTVLGALAISAPMIRTMKVDRRAMAKGLSSGFLEATEVADYLARNGVPFRTAHGVVRSLVEYAESAGKTLGGLSEAELGRFHPKLTRSVRPLLDPRAIVSAKSSEGGTSPASVKRQISVLRRLSAE